MYHSSSCSGCPHCDEQMRAVARIASAADPTPYVAWLTEQRHEQRAASMRTSIHQEKHMKNYDPPDGYQAALTAMRAAAATPESNFEDRWKASRRRALEQEYAEHAARVAAAPAALLTAAELVRYAAPDSYAAGIKALQSKERR